ncbi:MAG: hypothetical protein ACI808_001954 [Paraglaciecola sp.]|jgi:hypothetical protein
MLLSRSVMSVEDGQDLPSILDYYPNCSYQIIKNHKLGTQSDDPQSSAVIFKILEKLRKEAERVGADALILVEKKLSQVSSLKSTNERQSANRYRISYEAELIKNCIAEKNTKAKLAPYNHQGKKTLRDISTTIYRPNIEITLPERAKLNHPQITNREVSISNGIYGIPLGANYLTVLEKLGDPSAEVFLLEGEMIIGYGRRHWLYFRNNELVKVRSNSQFLSSMILNSVPLRDFFDDYKWKINDEIAYKTTFSKIKKIFNIDGQLDKKNNFETHQNGSILTLHFDTDKDHDTGKKIHTLSGFTLQKSSYKQQEIRPQIQPSIVYKAIQQAYIALQQEQDISWQVLAGNLGKPLAKITLSVDSELIIYTTNLLVNTKNSQMTTIHFVEQALLEHGPKSTSLELWHMGDFVQGKSVEQLEQYFLENAYSYDLEVEMEAEKYNLSLFFEDINGRDSLYEAKLELR